MAVCHEYMKDLKHNAKKQCMQEDQATSKPLEVLSQGHNLIWKLEIIKK